MPWADAAADTRGAPRTAHGEWTPPADRRDPVELLQASNDGRMPALVPARFGRMSASPFACYRGAAALMAADLAHTPTTGIRVQACGDAHRMNFGGFATPERKVIFDINDLDETPPAPWEWDLKRLAASVVIAAQFLKLSESEAARMARDLAREYRERMADFAAMRVLDVGYDRIDLQRYVDRAADPAVMDEVRKRMAERMAEAPRKNVPDHLYPKRVELQGTEHRIKDEPPLIFHPDESMAPALRSGYAEPLARYRRVCPSMCARCSTASTSATWRSRWSALARAHARSGDGALIAGCAGSSPTLDDAIADVAVACSDQNRTDYRAFIKPIRQGRFEVHNDL